MLDEGLKSQSSPDNDSSFPVPKFPAVRTWPVPCAISSPSLYSKLVESASEWYALKLVEV